MEKKRRNMLLYVTAASAVTAAGALGVACKDTPHAVGDVAQSPDDIRVGKVAMPVQDAAPSPAVPDTASAATTDAGAIPTAASSTPAADASAPKPRVPKPPGKIAPPPDKP